MRLLREVAVGLLLAIGLLALVEVVLAAAGLGRLEGAGASAFDPRRAYLVPDPEVPGGWRTQLFEGRREELRIPPKGERLRVVLLGGSNTRSFESGELDRRLHERAPGHYETINLGRAGYGSERTLIVFSQALAKLEPDVAVLYTGDNEHIESLSGRPPADTRFAALGALAPLARRSHILGLLSRLGPARESAAEGRPEPWVPAPDSYRGLPHEATLKLQARMRRNVETMCALAAKHGVPVVLCTIVFNHLSYPDAWNPPVDASPASVRRAEELRRAARTLIPATLHALFPAQVAQRVKASSWGGGAEPAYRKRPDRTLPGRRTCSGRYAHANPLLPATEHWQEEVHVVHEALGALFDRAFEAADLRRLKRAEKLLQRVVELFPGHAHALFELAVVRHALGRDSADVRDLFDRAAAGDCAPRKASVAVNTILRAVAEEVPGVTLLDAERRFRAGMPDGIVAYEWMLDHCHLTTGGRRLLMADLAELLVARWP